MNVYSLCSTFFELYNTCNKLHIHDLKSIELPQFAEAIHPIIFGHLVFRTVIYHSHIKLHIRARGNVTVD